MKFPKEAAMSRPLPIVAECADCGARVERPTADALDAFLQAHYRSTVSRTQREEQP